MTGFDDWEDVPNSSKMPQQPPPLPLTERPKLDELPPYALGPPQLNVLGATWGGVTVTQEVRDMVSSLQTIKFDMKTMHQIFAPDPVFGSTKSLTVLYRYDADGSEPGDPCLLVATEQDRSAMISEMQHRICDPLNKAIRKTYVSSTGSGMHEKGNSSGPPVEIIAVVYGPRRIETPSVMAELARFFEGRRGQIRMTNSFFKEDPWPNHRKSWSVYFRFVGSKNVQVVTGMEDGALEVPWTRA